MTMMSRKLRVRNQTAYCRTASSRIVSSETKQSGERGYTIVALLAVVTIILLLISAAAPSIRHQAQRSREEEAIARGEEVAEAIRMYVRKSRGKLPTSMTELLEGAPEGTKKVQVLRPAAARDPLSSSGEWKTIKRNDATFLAFQRAVTVYAGGMTPDTKDKMFESVAGQLPKLVNILDTDTKEEAEGGEDDSENSNGPFIGVVSRSRRNSIITYYGIDRHDQWVFTPYFK
jgi:type II secretory pathway pseudopilin PulG